MNSKRKGSGYEREVAHSLSDWLSKGTDTHIFMRRPLSGGMTRDHTGQSGHAGDIFADKPEGYRLTDLVVIETKTYADLLGDLWNFVAGKQNTSIEAFLLQTIRSVPPDSNKGWMLIVKSSRKPPLLFCNLFGTPPRPRFAKWAFVYGNHEVGVCAFQDFLDYDPDGVLQYMEGACNRLRGHGEESDQVL